MNTVNVNEFASADDHAAYVRAMASGQIRIHGGGVVTGTPPVALATPPASSGQHAILLREGGVQALRLHAPLQLDSASAGLSRKFSGIAYSGGLIPQFGAVIDLSTTRYNERLPLLNSHRQADIVGVVERSDHRSGAMMVAGRLFSDLPGSSAERIAQLAQRGAPFEMSVALYSYTAEAIDEDASVTVNGQTFKGPIMVLRNGQVREVSIVTLGADPATSARFQ